MNELTAHPSQQEIGANDNFGIHARRLLWAVCAIAIGVMLLASGANPLGIASARAQERGAADAELAQRHHDALQAFMAQRYAVAYRRFAALADEGHPHSALMALAMVTYPPSLRGEWSATAAQLQRWHALAMHESDGRAILVSENGGPE